MNRRKSGISLLLATQNTERTVELSVRSFVDFADEIIAVDNGSTDGTVEILQRLEREIPKLRFFNVPDLPDLFHNRQFAFERSQYRWIMRGDADFIANTSGPFDIRLLRQQVLSTKPHWRPLVFSMPTVHLVLDFRTTGILKEKRKGRDGHYVPPVITTLQNRIYEYFPGMKFDRIGRWEGVRYQRFCKNISLQNVYFFHCELKSEIDYLMRSERTNWREANDYQSYPSLSHFLNEAIQRKYGTTDRNKAAKAFMKEHVYPYLMPYDENVFVEYPEMIRNVLRPKRKRRT